MKCGALPPAMNQNQNSFVCWSSSFQNPLDATMLGAGSTCVIYYRLHAGAMQVCEIDRTDTMIADPHTHPVHRPCAYATTRRPYTDPASRTPCRFTYTPHHVTSPHLTVTCVHTDTCTVSHSLITPLGPDPPTHSTPPSESSQTAPLTPTHTTIHSPAAYAAR